MPRYKKGFERCHKSWTGNNQGRRRTNPRDNRGFNRKDCPSKSTEMSLPVISVSLPLNNSVINPPQLSLVCQHSKSNELSSPVIPKLPQRNDPFNNPTQLSSVRQQSSISLPNTTHELHELQSSSIPGRTSPDPSNTTPPPSTNNEWIIPWGKHRYHRWQQLTALWVNVIAIKAFVITRTVRGRPGWLLKNRGQLSWIDDRIIQWKRNRYHQ